MNLGPLEELVQIADNISVRTLQDRLSSALEITGVEPAHLLQLARMSHPKASLAHFIGAALIAEKGYLNGSLQEPDPELASELYETATRCAYSQRKISLGDRLAARAQKIPPSATIIIPPEQPLSLRLVDRKIRGRDAQRIADDLGAVDLSRQPFARAEEYDHLAKTNKPDYSITEARRFLRELYCRLTAALIYNVFIDPDTSDDRPLTCAAYSFDHAGTCAERLETYPLAIELWSQAFDYFAELFNKGDRNRSRDLAFVATRIGIGHWKNQEPENALTWYNLAESHFGDQIKNLPPNSLFLRLEERLQTEGLL